MPCEGKQAFTLVDVGCHRRAWRPLVTHMQLHLSSPSKLIVQTRMTVVIARMSRSMQLRGPRFSKPAFLHGIVSIVVMTADGGAVNKGGHRLPAPTKGPDLIGQLPCNQKITARPR